MRKDKIKNEVTPSRWWSKRLQLLTLCKDQQLTLREPKQLPRGKGHQQQSGAKRLRRTTQKGKEGSFILPAPCHPISSQHCSVARGTSWLKIVAPPRERKRSVRVQLPQTCRELHKFPLGFQPTPRLAKLKCIETPKNEEENQGLPTSSITQWEPWWFPVTFPRKTQQLLPLKKPKPTQAGTGPLQITPALAPHFLMPAT